MERFTKKVQAQFDEMCKTEKLFRVNLSGQEVWDLYLNSFTKEENPIFRSPESSTYNCNHCKNFIRRYGNIVAIDEEYNIVTMFDVVGDEEFTSVVKALTKAIKSAKVTEVFFETFAELNNLPYESCSKSNKVFRLGVDKNEKQYTKEEAELYGVVKPQEIRRFNHLHLSLPKLFVDTTGSSVESIMGNFRDSKTVFARAMEEISLDTLKLVKDLIIQGSLLNGDAHLHKIEQIVPLKAEYDDIPKKKRDNWCWVKSYKLPFAKFKNELIGVLCSDLSEGEELNKACELWNKRIDPANYMKAKAPITKKQIEEAKAFVEENGFAESFDRRFATIKDVKLSEIKHINKGKGEIKSVSIFDNVKSTSTRHKRSEFDGVEEVGIEKFMADILPTCSSVEAYFKNSHKGNLVSLTTANNPDSKPIFKWTNNYSWTFNGNLAGKSEIKEAVKSAGGKIDGVLRFSIAWNEGGKEILDFDAHASEPSGREINFSTHKTERCKTPMSGYLDVDMIRPMGLGVENIVWDVASAMQDGRYTFWIKNFDGGNNKGFKAEIEFNGEVYTYEYNSPLSYKQDIHVAEVTLNKGEFDIKHLIPESTVSSKEVYGIETNQFHKVNLICLSPNHWDDNKIGNKHYLFMLEGCKCPTSIRSFHNENLIPELLTHRKVMEVLGATNHIEPTDKQLSGLGFNATVKDELIVKIQGTHKRMLKIKFK